MCKHQAKWLMPLMLAALAILMAAPGTARTCDIDTVPAATLLLPYFEVDVSGGTPRSMDTAFAILNTESQVSKPHFVHVTLWTEWAIPTVGFNIQLGANDELSVNLIDVLTAGAPQGAATCAGTTRPGPLYFHPALPFTGDPAKDLATLRKAHTGEAFTTPTGAKVASTLHPGLAKGYITIDVVKQCTDLFPSSPAAQGYFRDGGTGIATNDNVLVGDYFLVDNVTAMGVGEPMVHIRADKTFKGGDYTFYGRYVGGSGIDDRQPLGSVYASRFWTTFLNNPTVNPRSELIVWRDVKRRAPQPVPVATRPPGYPIPLSDMLCCDENERCINYSDASALPLATQRIDVSTDFDLPFGAGWMKLDLNHAGSTLFKNKAQGFVVTIFRAHTTGGEMGAGFRAFRLGTPCTP